MDSLTRGKWLLPVLLLAVVLLPGGEAVLVQSKQDYFINPDGSGKVRIEAKWDVCEKKKKTKKTAENDILSALIPDCNITPKELLGEIFKGSRAVAAWKDIRFEKRKVKGRWDVTLKGVAYFRDIHELRLRHLLPLELSFTRYNKTRYLHLEFRPVNSYKNYDGALFLNLKYLSWILADDILKKKTPEKRREQAAEMEAEAKEKKGKKNSAALEYTRFRLEINLFPPGEVVSTNNLHRASPNGLQMVIDGANALAIQEVYFEEQVPYKIAAANSADPLYRFLLEKLLGNDGPITAELSGPFKALFDYEKEVAEAQKALPAMMKRLELDKVEKDKEKKKE